MHQKKHNESEQNCILPHFLSKITKLQDFSRNFFSKSRLRWIFSVKATRLKFLKCIFLMLVSSQNMNFYGKSRDFDQFETSRKSRLDVEKSRSRKPSRLSRKSCLDETFATPTLDSFFGFPISTWLKSEPKRSLDTSAVSFPSRSTGEEFECENSIVLSISLNWWTIGERIHCKKTGALI